MRRRALGVLPGCAQWHLPPGAPLVRSDQAVRSRASLVNGGHATRSRYGRYGPPPHLRRPHRQWCRGRHSRLGARARTRVISGPLPAGPAGGNPILRPARVANPTDVPLNGGAGYARAGARWGKQPSQYLQVRQCDVPDQAEPRGFLPAVPTDGRRRPASRVGRAC